MNKCEICGEEYDRAETNRVFGDMHWTFRFCSAQCYTAAVMTPNQKKFRAWWMPNPPREPFHQEFDTKEKAQAALELLADYDLYLGEHLIGANAGGVEELDDDGEWSEIDEDEPNE